MRARDALRLRRDELVEVRVAPGVWIPGAIKEPPLRREGYVYVGVRPVLSEDYDEYGYLDTMPHTEIRWP